MISFNSLLVILSLNSLVFIVLYFYIKNQYIKTQEASINIFMYEFLINEKPIFSKENYEKREFDHIRIDILNEWNLISKEKYISKIEYKKFINKYNQKINNFFTKEINDKLESMINKVSNMNEKIKKHN